MKWLNIFIYIFLFSIVFIGFFFFFFERSELAMLLSMAQSNPALFQMISDRKTVARQLERLSRLKELMDTTAEQLWAKQNEDWSCWIKKYRYRKEALSSFNLMHSFPIGNEKFIIKHCYLKPKRPE